ncbi:cation transporting ATPase C-terminal domain-containing protein [bacterium]|nr:cation transporting ATPase C-terminal domain-containing protein [bacterium]
MIIFIASICGMPAPLLAIQILWLNLVTDSLPALAL